MSTASRARTIKFVRKIGTITGELICNQGKLQQRYTGSGVNGDWGEIYPSWDPNAAGAIFPIVEIVFTSSVINTSTGTNELGIIRTDAHPIKLTIGGSTIEFGDNIEPRVAAGFVDSGNTLPYFRMLKPGNTIGGFDTHGHHALQFRHNMVNYYNGQSIPYTITCWVEYNGAEVEVSISDKIDIARGSAEEAMLSIIAANGTDFTLGSDSEYVDMLPMLHVGSANVTTNSDYTYDWSIVDPSAAGGWAALPNGTGKTGAQTVRVTGAQVGTYGYVRCQAKKAGRVIATAMQPIIDTSDGYYIEPNPDPEDETIEEGNDDRNHVTYTPRLYKILADGSTSLVSGMLFKFMFTSPAGTPIPVEGFNDPQNTGFTTSLDSCTATEGMCRQSGADLSVIIIADN